MRFVVLMGLGFSLMGFPAMSQAATEMDSTALSDAAEPGARTQLYTPAAVQATLDSRDGTLEPSDELPMALHVIETSLVAQVTGAESPNDTAARWDVHGTDLGHMFRHRDKLYMVFGDTFGEGGVGGKNWRSNVLARLADPGPRQGLRIEAMLIGPNGAAREVIRSRKIDGVEKT